MVKIIDFEVPVNIQGTTMYLHVMSDPTRDTVEQDYYSFVVLINPTTGNLKTEKDLEPFYANSDIKQMIEEAVEKAKQLKRGKEGLSKVSKAYRKLILATEVQNKEKPYLYIFLKTDGDSLLKMAKHVEGSKRFSYSDFFEIEYRAEKLLLPPPDFTYFQALLNFGPEISKLLELMTGSRKLSERLHRKAGY